MSTTLFDEVRSGTSPPLLPITVDQFQQMIHSGILHDGDPIELIDGFMVRKDRSSPGENIMGHNPRHALLVSRGCANYAWREVCGAARMRLQK